MEDRIEITAVTAMITFEGEVWHDSFIEWLCKDLSNTYILATKETAKTCIDKADDVIRMLSGASASSIEMSLTSISDGKDRRVEFDGLPATSVLGTAFAILTAQYEIDTHCEYSEYKLTSEIINALQRKIADVFVRSDKVETMKELGRILSSAKDNIESTISDTQMKSQNGELAIFAHYAHRKHLAERKEKVLEEELEQAQEEIKKYRSELAELKHALRKTNGDITCGPYKIADHNKTAFMSVIWMLKELNFFEKKNNGTYATNRTDVIQQLMEGKANADQLLPKALKTDTFMNVFNDLRDKAAELYQK